MPVNLDTSQFFSFLNTPLFHSVIFVVRIIFIVASVGFLGFIIWALVKTLYLKRLFFYDLQEFMTVHSYGAKKLYSSWQKIKKRLETGLESEYKLAVIEADLIIDDILKGAGFTGATFSERVNNLTEATLPNLQELIGAHATRNNIIHDPDYKISLGEAKKTVEIYETALTDLQAL